MKDIPIAFIDDETIYESEDFVNFKLQEKDKEIERLHSIIKEIREYLTNNAIFDINDKGVNKIMLSILQGVDKK